MTSSTQKGGQAPLEEPARAWRGRGRTLAAFVVVLALAAGCSRGGGGSEDLAPAPVASSPVTASPTPAPDVPDTRGLLVEGELETDDRADDGVDARAVSTALNAEDVRSLSGLPTPSGSVTAIALRFMRALRAGHWPAAAAELNLPARNRLSLTTPEFVTGVLEDVRRNAGGDALGSCDRAQRVKSDLVVVTCGQTRVVVHLQSLVLRGVQISAEHPRQDVARGAHTHAYSELAP